MKWSQWATRMHSILDLSREEALGYWFEADTQTYVAEDAGRAVGTYILRPNQSGGGSHVANAAFMVAPEARGHGIGRAMGEHCLSEARRLSFRAMQFNFVVSTNESAIRLWKQLGFKIVGTLPGAFRSSRKGIRGCLRNVTARCLKTTLSPFSPNKHCKRDDFLLNLGGCRQ